MSILKMFEWNFHSVNIENKMGVYQFIESGQFVNFTVYFNETVIYHLKTMKNTEVYFTGAIALLKIVETSIPQQELNFLNFQLFLKNYKNK